MLKLVYYVLARQNEIFRIDAEAHLIAFRFLKSNLANRIKVALKIFTKNQNRVNRFLCVSLISFD